MRAAASLVTILLLAGCMAPGSPDMSDGALEAMTVPWGLTECDLVVAFVPVDAARVQPYLPEGFRPLTFAEAGFPPDPRGSGNVGTEMFVCSGGAGLNGTVEPMTYGSVFVQVAAPEGLASPDNLMNFVKWDVLVPDADRRALLQARGVPAMEGGAAFTTFAAEGDQALFEGELQLNGTTGFRGTALAPADDSLRDFRFTEFTPTPHGLAMWNTTVVLSAASAGAGTVELSGLAAEMVGASEAQAYYLAAHGDFADATLWLPPVAAGAPTA